MLTRALLLSAVLTSNPEREWKYDRTVDGLKVELREVDGSPYPELRISSTSAVTMSALCDAIWAKRDSSHSAEAEFKKRVVVSETDNDRVTYEQIHVPVVADRDYLIHVSLVQPADSGRCEVVFETLDDPAYPPTRDHVRIKTIRGHWLVNPTDDGKVTVSYTVFSEPGGSVPAFLARGGQRDAAVSFYKTILGRAAQPPKVP